VNQAIQPGPLNGTEMHRNRQAPIIDLPALEPRPFDNARGVERDGEPPVAHNPSRRTPLPSPRVHVAGRWRRVVTIVIAAALASAATYTLEHVSRPSTPRWVRACREAIDATTQLHQTQARQLDQIMYETWSIIGGLHIKASPIDTPLEAQLQRDADNATSRCITPTASSP
jgi:hypothetical protein